jgi:hypothetical protein
VEFGEQILSLGQQPTMLKTATEVDEQQLLLLLLLLTAVVASL